MLTFFFQAEDGIRDGRVTGVQTCALPISPQKMLHQHTCHSKHLQLAKQTMLLPSRYRSEERRVGKECRSRWSPDAQKKKGNNARGDVGPLYLSCVSVMVIADSRNIQPLSR